MTRTGYLRWQVHAVDSKVPGDPWSRQVSLWAEPSYRTVRIKGSARGAAEEAFVQGTATYAEVLRQVEKGNVGDDIRVPDVGPRVWKYSASDREMPRYWFTKLQREVSSFAREVVRAATAFPRLVVSNSALRDNYARMVEHETMRVIDGKSAPEPMIVDRPMEIDVTQFRAGVPELVAAELVRDVMEPDHFVEFCRKNYVTVRNGGKVYRIPRRTHGLIEVWGEDGRKEARLCVVFQDPGMPPSDEVVMKYLLAKHAPDELWRVANRFPAGADVPPE